MKGICRDLLYGGLSVAIAFAASQGLGAERREENPQQTEQILPNNIRLPAAWPPQRRALTFEPAKPPYLEAPPDVIRIDVGRQLFVDDFLIQQTTLIRTFHRPTYHPSNPVLKADRPWEHEADGPRQGALAMPFSGGAWYDPLERLFKMWYHADYGKRHLCLATSQDGVRWEKPSFDVVPGTNIVFPEPGSARVVWLDLEEKDPERRYKLIVTRGGEDLIAADQKWWGSKGSMYVHFSPDGIHWSKAMSRTGPTGDRNSAFWNPFRKRWVFSIREYSPLEGGDRPLRCRRYWESPDLVANLPWTYHEPTMWVGADRRDIMPDEYRMQPELYNLDAVAYESLLLGLFSILRRNADTKIYRPKINEVCVGFSRDGFHWDRPDRRSFCPVSERPGAWNWGNTQSVGGGCLVVGDKLYFYVSGRAGSGPHFHDAGGSAGLAVLRRDGFASMDADRSEGTLTTRPVHFSGKHLFVNADAASGQLCVEVLDREGRVIEPFDRANCVAVDRDAARVRVAWRGVEDLSAVSGEPVRFRFYLRSAGLYAFWVSPDRSGASHGYVAAGGPGFTGPIDAD